MSQNELQSDLRNELETMYAIVRDQWLACKTAFFNRDIVTCEKIIEEEKKVNALEIRIDRTSERLLALHTPVAIDLRYILSALKINTYLERIGDNIEGIARNILTHNTKLPDETVQFFRLNELFDSLDKMVVQAAVALENEDVEIARTLTVLDKEINNIDASNRENAQLFIDEKKGDVNVLLHVLSSCRKVERIGDLIKNVGEEIIFYKEAIILKHKGNKVKKKEIKEVLKEDSGL